MTSVEKKIIKARIALLTSQPFWGTLAMRLRMVEMSDRLRASLIARGLMPTMAVDGKNVHYAPEFVEQLSHADTMTVIAHEVSHCVFDHIGRRGNRNPNKWNKAGDYVINEGLVQAGFSFDGPGGWLLNPAFDGMTADQVYNLLPDDPEGDKSGPAMCDIMDGESRNDPALTDEWKLATAQAAAVAQQAGKLPASMKRFVEDMLNPKTDWRTQLRRFITEISKADYSWQRPNKKMLGAHGFYLPSLYSENMGTIAIAIDTSGSITQAMLNLFSSEINAIRNDVHPEKTVIIYCDAQVNKVVEFTAEDPIVLEMVGGGSTSFRPPFSYLEQEAINPAAFLYLTDGYGDGWPTAGFPVMWCITTNVEPDSGERIQLEMED